MPRCVTVIPVQLKDDDFADLYYVTWFPLDNPEDIRARDISGDVETEGIGRTVRSVIEGLR